VNRRFCLGLVLVAVFGSVVWLLSHEIMRHRSVEALESKQAELRKELMNLQTNFDRERLHWYYAFREVEEPDDRAWELASRKVNSEIATKSNALARVEAALARMRTREPN
jgi:hypothetical protein